MTVVDVFLGGEGRNELGSRFGDPVYQHDDEPGVVASLLLRCHAQGWRVVGATAWKNIAKLRAKGPTPTEEKNVLGLVVEARRASAHVVAFVRDADDDPERPTVIDAAIAKAKQTFPEVNVIGGAAVPVLEGWMLALLGAQGTQQLRKAAAQSKLAEMGVPSKNTRAMVEVVSNSDLDRVPTDAESLGKWLALARAALPRPGSHA